MLGVVDAGFSHGDDVWGHPVRMMEEHRGVCFTGPCWHVEQTVVSLDTLGVMVADGAYVWIPFISFK